MGQYYIPTVKNENGFHTYDSYDYDNGLKLMEHSYIGNELVAAVINQIWRAPGRVWWLGDYAETSDFQPGKDHKLYKNTREALWSGKLNVEPAYDNDAWEYDNQLIINHTKKEYIKIPEQTDDCVICALPILTAVGNGRGGGDYFGINMDYVGAWTGDIIEVREELKPEWSNYTNKTNTYIFKEDKE